ncbi:MAG: SUMF1/EgtB/PvdO family nonheme iron enzyme [Gemmatimonadaceae bacterium]|nr:SUMF1/EgtB/PvdO family nonheme iron enzyme [Gemmatimonadaceae bacterium]
MDITEVTVAAYRSCSATGCTTPGTTMFCNWGVADRDNHPINCIDWSQSSAYCQSRGGTLPTEAQWEYAARGTDGRIYPWGSDAPASQLCWSRTTGVGPGSGCPVGSFLSGVSPFGLLDMAGNVSEWALDWYGSYGPIDATNPTGASSGSHRVARGGGWDDTEMRGVRSTYRNLGVPSFVYYSFGFRCVHAPL